MKENEGVRYNQPKELIAALPVEDIKLYIRRKRIVMLYVLILLGVLIIAITLFVTSHPVFGKNPSKEDKEAYRQFENYAEGKFSNQIPTKMDMGIAAIFSLMRDSIKGNKDRNPKTPIPVLPINWNQLNRNQDSLIWFGHSTFFLQLDGKKILLDPMFGPIPSPVTVLGSKRYSKDLLYILDELPPIDAVLITHDHYDHLDYPSIKRLREKVGHFFVPYGVAAHLKRWGVGSEKITELNWWDEIEWKGLSIASVPAQHFSGRGPTNRDTTLWAGWVIVGRNNRLYTSGDGGYGPHFKQIGEKYGPFDITLIEGGQYDQRWSSIHMMPEESIQAHLDVKGNNMMLIHWGAFTLAYHGWTDPVERAIREAKEKEVHLITPKIGEIVLLNGTVSVSDAVWWQGNEIK
jgi:L-ascorbate metabolism protein UlaG (beta-lactamase superfamily)